jgi:2-polyprenyl-3-methyl-5-hydroxy-6-metoxy-1,4-benzoquinol methylase
MSLPSLPELPPSISPERLRGFATEAFWYHTLEFPHGIQTAGVYQLRPHLHFFGFPPSLAGETVLDVGAADGFFSFEFEKRGAAEVLAVDNNPADGSVNIDISPAHRGPYLAKYESVYRANRQFQEVYNALSVPVGHNFLAARAILGSQVEFLNLSAYELPSLKKHYDLVFCGDLIEHLKNPLAVLENLAAVTGKLCIISLSNVITPGPQGCSRGSDSWQLRGLRRLAAKLRMPLANMQQGLEYHGNVSGGSFFHFYPETFRQALLASGFHRVEIYSYFDLPNLKHASSVPHAVYHCYAGETNSRVCSPKGAIDSTD